MNRILSIAAAAVMVVAAASCSGDKKEDSNIKTIEEAREQFASELQNADTTQVLQMGREFLQSLQDGKVDAALDMLYAREMVDSTETLRKLNEGERKSLARRFELMPVKSFNAVPIYYDFSIPAINDLKYEYVFDPESSTGKQTIMFNPIKRDGQWYLMLKQPDQPAQDANNAFLPGAAIAMPEESKK
ncbi:MAG: hypothetical protein NC342_04870 [Pseudoflavonifractor sp.]|nr:hypothetical protein [Alloprevotella sp.]MCM1116850.1 hypothetical protein [Pseudoflavonifractor sp.]